MTSGCSASIYGIGETHAVARDSDSSLIAMLSHPHARLSSLINLPDRFNADM
jgi:hypothetical protein